MTGRIPLDDLTSDQLDTLYDRLDLLQRGAVERSALLEEARDALEAAGITEAHGGESWPQLAPAIEHLAKDRDFWKQLAQDAREAECRRTAERDEQQTRAVRAEAALDGALSPVGIRAAAEAIGDEALTHLGRDIGTIHADHIAEAGLRAALDQAQQPTA